MPPRSPSPRRGAGTQRHFGIDTDECIAWRGNWQPGGEYITSIHLRNATLKTVHINHVLPKAKQFYMSFPDAISIPPGITHAVEVRFRPTSWEALDDAVTFSVDRHGTFNVRVIAALASLVVDVTPAVDFGDVAVNEPTRANVVLVNRGQAEAMWAFEVGAPFVFSPLSGRLSPGSRVEVSVAVVPQEACTLRAIAVCLIQGGEQRIPVALSARAKHAHFVVDKIMSGDTPGAVKAPGSNVSVSDGVRASIDFGDVPLGITPPERHVTFLNDSPVAAFIEVAMEGENSISGGGGGDARPPGRFTVTPSQAFVAAGTKTVFTIRLETSTAGVFICEHFRFSTPGGNTIALSASARVSGPRVRLARRDRSGNLVSGARGVDGPWRPLVIQFGDSKVGERTTQVITVQNQSMTTPALWDLDAEESGVFEFSTQRGVVGAGCSVDVSVTFLAPSPGNFYRRVAVLIAHGEPSSLDIIGTAYNETLRPAPLRARHVEAFRLRAPQLRLLSPDDALPLIKARGPDANPRERSFEAEWALTSFPSRSGDISRAGKAVFRELFMSVADSSRPIFLRQRSVDFGASTHGALPERRSVHITNRTSGRVSVSWVLPPSVEGAYLRDFNVLPIANEIDPGATAEYAVCFSPSKNAEYFSTELECFVSPKQNRSFRLVDDESFTPPLCLPLRVCGHTFPPNECFVPRVVTCFGGSSREQALSLPPAAVGDDVYYTFQIANYSEVPAHFNFAFEGVTDAGSIASGEMASLGGVFAIVPPSGLVAMHEFQLITVRFRPRAPRAYQAALTLNLNNDMGGGAISISLSGRGSLPRLLLPDGGAVFIKPTCLGLASTRAVTLRNAGAVPLRFDIRVPKARASELSVIPAHGDILPGGNVSVSVRFSPSSTGGFRVSVPVTVYSATGSETNALTLLQATAASADLSSLEAALVLTEGSIANAASSGLTQHQQQIAAVRSSTAATAASRALLNSRQSGRAPVLDLSALHGDSLLLGIEAGAGEIESGGSAAAVALASAARREKGEVDAAPVPVQRLLLAVASEGLLGALRWKTPARELGAVIASSGIARAPLELTNTSDVYLHFRVDAVVQLIRSTLDYDEDENMVAATSPLDFPYSSQNNNNDGDIEPDDLRIEFEAARINARALSAQATAASATDSLASRGGAIRTLALRTDAQNVCFAPRGARGKVSGAAIPLITFEPASGVLSPHATMRIEVLFTAGPSPARYRFRVYAETTTVDSSSFAMNQQQTSSSTVSARKTDLPGAAIGRAAAFAAAASAETDTRDPATVDIELEGLNTNSLFADVRARVCFPSITFEDARSLASREALMTIMPRHYAGSASALTEVFAPTHAESLVDAKASVQLGIAATALNGAGSLLGWEGDATAGAPSIEGNPSAAPPPLPAASELYAQLTQAPLRDFWVRPEGFRMDAIASGFGVPLEVAAKPWYFAMPWERGGLAVGGVLPTGSAFSEAAAETARLLSLGVAARAAAGAAGVTPLGALERIIAGEVAAARRARLGIDASPFSPQPGGSAIVPSPSAGIPTWRLWEALSLRELNAHLAARLSQSELTYNATTQESRDPTSLASFAFEFPPAPMGSPPNICMLQLRNNGVVPARIDFQLPTERDCAVEPWAEEMDEPTEDEFNDNELIGRNIMGVYPRTLLIAPGAAAAVRVHYAYATSVADGKHESVVMLRVRGGKSIRLLLRGLTLPRSAAYLYSGLPDRVKRLASVPLGLALPPIQLIHVRNPSAQPLRFAVLPDELDAASVAAFGVRVWTCLDMEGLLGPGEETCIRVIFAPVEVRAYTLRLRVAYERATGVWDPEGLRQIARTSISEAAIDTERRNATNDRAAAIASHFENATAAEDAERDPDGAAGLGADVPPSIARAAAAAAFPAAAGVGFESGEVGYEADIDGVLELTLLARGYAPGGAALGGTAATPLAPFPPQVLLGVCLPAPPAPLPLDAGGGVNGAHLVLDRTVAAAALKGGGGGGLVRFGHPSASLLNATFSLAPAIITVDGTARVQATAGTLSYIGTCGGPDGARVGGGGGASSDALSAAAFASLGLDPTSAGVSTQRNIVDAALRLGIAAIAAGADAAALAHRLLCFGAGALGIDDGAAGPESVVNVSSVIDGDDNYLPPSTQRQAAQAQLRSAQSILAALTASGPAAAGAGASEASELLIRLASEAARTAHLSFTRRRSTAPYKGFTHVLGQAQDPRSGVKGVPWGPRMRATLYSLIGRLASRAAGAHLYRPGETPERYFGSGPPTRRWAPIPHDDTPEGFGMLSTEWLRIGDSPCGGSTTRTLLIRNLRTVSGNSNGGGGYHARTSNDIDENNTQTGSLHFTFDSEHPLIASGALSLEPRFGTLPPGGVRVIIARWSSPAVAAIWQADIACLISVPPSEVRARAEEALIRAGSQRARAAARFAALPLAARTVHTGVAGKTTIARSSKLEALAGGAAIRAQVKAVHESVTKGRTVYALADGGGGGVSTAAAAAAATRMSRAMPSSRGYVSSSTPRNSSSQQQQQPQANLSNDQYRSIDSRENLSSITSIGGGGSIAIGASGLSFTSREVTGGHSDLPLEQQSTAVTVGGDGTRLAATAARARAGAHARLASRRVATIRAGFAAPPLGDTLDEMDLALDETQGGALRRPPHARVLTDRVSAIQFTDETQSLSVRGGVLSDDVSSQRRSRIAGRTAAAAHASLAPPRQDSRVTHRDSNDTNDNSAPSSPRSLAVAHATAVRLIGNGDAGQTHEALALLPPPPHAILWLHVSARSCSLKEFESAYSPAHMAAFEAPPLPREELDKWRAVQESEPVGVVVSAAAMPTPITQSTSATIIAPPPPPPAALSLITSILSEIAADVTLAPLAARLSTTTVVGSAGAVSVSTKVNTVSARPPSSLLLPQSPVTPLPYDEWAPERALVGGGLTFSALTAAHGDVIAANAAIRAAAAAATAVASTTMLESNMDQAIVAAALEGRPTTAASSSPIRATTPGKPSMALPLLPSRESRKSGAMQQVPPAAVAAPALFDTSIPTARFGTSDVALSQLSQRALTALASCAVAPLAGALLRGLIAELGDAIVCGDEDLGLRGGLPLSRAAVTARILTANGGAARIGTTSSMTNFPPKPLQRLPLAPLNLDGIVVDGDDTENTSTTAMPAYKMDAYDD